MSSPTVKGLFPSEDSVSADISPYFEDPLAGKSSCEGLVFSEVLLFDRNVLSLEGSLSIENASFLKDSFSFKDASSPSKSPLSVKGSVSV